MYRMDGIFGRLEKKGDESKGRRQEPHRSGYSILPRVKLCRSRQEGRLYQGYPLDFLLLEYRKHCE